MASVELMETSENIPEERAMITRLQTDASAPALSSASRRTNKLTMSAQVDALLGMVIIMTFLSGAVFVGTNNPEIFVIDSDTVILLNQVLNAFVILAIPFLFGIIGAIARLLLSGVRIVEQFGLAIGSGLLAAFSWIGIKSGVFIAILAPHLEKQGLQPIDATKGPDSFYTLVLVALFVGMFATNLYLFVSNRVAQLSQTERSQKEIS